MITIIVPSNTGCIEGNEDKEKTGHIQQATPFWQVLAIELHFSVNVYEFHVQNVCALYNGQRDVRESGRESWKQVGEVGHRSQTEQQPASQTGASSHIRHPSMYPACLVLLIILSRLVTFEYQTWTVLYLSAPWFLPKINCHGSMEPLIVN